MSLEDKINHLANMSIIMDFHEKLGTTKNKFIMREFQAIHDEVEQELAEKYGEEE